MNNTQLHRYSGYLIAAVWFGNGLLCKVIGLVPRHEAIVANILGFEYAHILTIAIGVSEVFIGIWILSKIAERWGAIAQIGIVLTMNTLEFLLVPELLLWGKLNSFFAVLFTLVVYFRTFILKPKLKNV